MGHIGVKHTKLCRLSCFLCQGVAAVSHPWDIHANSFSKIMCVLLLLKQESGEFAEGLHARTLPLGFPALPARRTAEGPDADGTLRPLCSVCAALPPPALLLLCHLLPRPHSFPRPAPHHGAVSHADIPSEPQHGRARLPPPDTCTHLPQPQPNTAAAVAVASSSTFPRREMQRAEATLFGCMPNCSSIPSSTGSGHSWFYIHSAWFYREASITGQLQVAVQQGN